jgi:hypothetical protein
MIDNTAHAMLLVAAAEAGWDLNTMLRLVTRFLAARRPRDPTIRERFKAYLEEEVTEEQVEEQDAL